MSTYMFVIPGEEYSFPFYHQCTFSKKKNLDGNFVLVMKTKHLYNVIILTNNHFFSLLKLSNYLENNRP